MESKFLKILEEELVQALGCTEPTAYAIAAAKCREVLGEFPEKILVRSSGNMIKNVQGVVIPHSNGLRGVENAVILGALIGLPEKGLRILEYATDLHIKQAEFYNSENMCTSEKLKSDAKLHVEITMEFRGTSATVELMHTHTNIVKVDKDGKQLLHNPCSEDDFNSSLTDRSELTIRRIFDFANDVDYKKLKKILKKQLVNNMDISIEGLTNDWGLGVGKTIEEKRPKDCIGDKMRAAAAAGSDARMSGCDLPVIINSGSGNQGMTIAIPIEIYSQEMNISDEMKYRALAIANLVPIHIKTRIGRLSAFCGAVTAAIGVGCAISYMKGGDYHSLERTIKNSVANLTGVICDGAKSSCALKIASSIDAALLAESLAQSGKVVESGTGIIVDCVEETIKNMVNVATIGMTETERTIFDIMFK